MSWKKYLNGIKWFDIWQGMNSTAGDTPFDAAAGSSFLQTAQNVYSPPFTMLLQKRPGFTKVRPTAISADGAFTSMIWQSTIADNFLMTVSRALAATHKIYQDSADPPVAIAGGTDFTVGVNNLISAANFTDGTTAMTIFASRLRDTMQSVTGALTRADFSPTGTVKAMFLEVFGQRLLFGAPSLGATTYDDRVYYSDQRNGKTLTDNTVQFQTFETSDKDSVTGLKKYGEICVTGKNNSVFYLAPTSFAAQPFGFPREIPSGKYKGVVSHQSMVVADRRLFYMSQTNIQMIDPFLRVVDVGTVIKPTIRGLNDLQRQYAVADFDSVNRLVLFAVANGSDTTNKNVIALNVDTGALYLWTLARNAFAQRIVSSAERLIGGGYAGLFYNEMTGTAGDLDDATAVIDADVITPRYWLNGYGVKQKIPYIFFTVAPIGTETVTVQYQLDDGQTWLNPAATFKVSGTSHQLFAVDIRGVAERIHLRFRNNTAAEAYALKAVGIPGAALVPVVK